MSISSPPKTRCRNKPLDKVEFYNDCGTSTKTTTTTTTCTESSNDSITSSPSSQNYSLEYSPLSTPRTKKKRWTFSAYRGTTNNDPSHSRSTRTALSLLATFVLLFLLQVWGFRTVANLRPTRSRPRYSTTNPNPSWCPQATCHNSPPCRPCDRRFLIVIATGRSGSTTVTDMLNMLPGVRMAGENNGHLVYGFKAMMNLERTEDFYLNSRTEVEGAWRHYPIPKQSTVCPIQSIFESMNPPPEEEMDHDDSGTILGFKTVRFHDEDMFGEDHVASVEYLKETFPCARFVINVRKDVQAQKASWLKAFGTEKDDGDIRKYTRRLENVAAELGEGRALLIDMSEWGQKDGSGLYVLNDVIEWLGFKDCRFSHLLHANKDGYGADTMKEYLGEDCRQAGK